MFQSISLGCVSLEHDKQIVETISTNDLFDQLALQHFWETQPQLFKQSCISASAFTNGVIWWQDFSPVRWGQPVWKKNLILFGASSGEITHLFLKLF